MSARINPALKTTTTTVANATSMTEARPDVVAPMTDNSHLLRINILFFNCSVSPVCWPSVGGCACRTCLPSAGRPTGAVVGRGTIARSAVPRPSDSISSLPLSSLSRSRIPAKPTPFLRVLHEAGPTARRVCRVRNPVFPGSWLPPPGENGR